MRRTRLTGAPSVRAIVLDSGKYLTLAVGVANRRVGRRLFPGDIGDHAESLGDQLDDPLIQVTETAAEGNELAVGFSHAGSSTGPVTSSRCLSAARSRGRRWSPAAPGQPHARIPGWGSATGAHKSTAAP